MEDKRIFEYMETCEDCIHYAKKSYMFGNCEICRHEVACDSFCINFLERWHEDEQRR